MLVSTQRRELLFERITKHTFGREIDERNLKILSLTYFRPKRKGNVEKNNNPVNIRFVAKTSDIRNLFEERTSYLKSC